MLQPLGTPHSLLGLEKKTNGGESFGQRFPLGQPVDQDGKDRSGQTEKEEGIKECETHHRLNFSL